MKGCTLLAAALLCVSGLTAQRWHVVNLTVSDGLSQSEVSDIVEDEQGRILLNTGGFGVDLYDGRRFERKTDFGALGESFVHRILQESDGPLWYVNLRGMYSEQDGESQLISFGEASRGMVSIYCAIRLSSGGYLIGGSDGVIVVDDQGRASRVVGPEAGLKVFGALQLVDGRALLATQDGLYIYSESQGLQVAQGIYASVPRTEYYSLIKAESGQLVLGGQGHLVILDDKGLSSSVALDGHDNNSVISLALGDEGILLAGTNGSGLYMVRDGVVVDHLTENGGLSDDYVWSIMRSRNGDIWIGTSGAGVDVISSTHFRHYTTDEGLPGDVVYAVDEDDNGNIWLGIVTGGVTIIDRSGEVRSYTESDGLSHRTVRSLMAEKDTIYIGTENGLTIYHHGFFEDVSDLFGLRDQAIFDIHRDSRGVLWFACKGERYFGPNGGVARRMGSKTEIFRAEDGLGDNSIYFIHEDEEGLWFGTASGIARYAGGQMEAVNIRGLCSNNSICMRRDKWGSRWLGSIGGLSVIEGDSAVCLSASSKIQARTVYFIEIQSDTILWVGSAEGLERIDLASYHRSGDLEVIHFDDRSGFIGTEANQNAVFSDSRGLMWFGTIEGAVRYDDQLYRGMRRLGRPVIRRAQVNAGDDGQVDMMQDGGTQYELQHWQKSISFDYDIIDPVASGDYSFSIRLDGLEEEWSPLTDQRSVFYSTLPPGRYQFRLKAWSKSTDRWTEEVSLAFVIVPAFYQELWFKALVVLLSIGLLALLYYWRLTQFKARQTEQRQFERQLHEVEMTALRAQMNPHFLFNSLNSVNSFIIKKDKAEASAYLTKFARLVRLILLNSKEKTVSLASELEALRLYIDMEALRFDEAFEVIYDIDEEIDLTTYRIPPLLLQPYVENAIWHGLMHLQGRAGRLDIRIRKQRAGLVVEIEDNGVGRAKAAEMKSRSADKNRSMGMAINADRMRLTEGLYGYRTTTEIIDKVDEVGEGSGTLVRITLAYE